MINGPFHGTSSPWCGTWKAAIAAHWVCSAVTAFYEHKSHSIIGILLGSEGINVWTGVECYLLHKSYEDSASKLITDAVQCSSFLAENGATTQAQHILVDTVGECSA